MKKLKTYSQGLAIRGGQSLIALAIAAFSAGVIAQGTQIEEIVVTGTGTSIRGEQPVGQNLISIGREAIEESGAVSVQQILNDVPQITGFGNSAQGGYGASDGAGTYSPTIHSLGASASNSTLIVINGHRMPLTGISHNTGDPTIIPPAALERVEILPDGASATYGSDAVAGVLNFVTRTDVEGVEMSAQTGFSEGAYKTANFNLLTGSTWSGGSFTAAYAYAYRSALANSDRPNIRSDLRNVGGSNFADDNCGPGATLDTGSAKYLFPYSNTNTIPANGNPCDTRAYTTLISSEARHSVFFGYEQEYGDNLKFDLEAIYSQRRSDSEGSRGTPNISINADAAGFTNPYFVAAPDGTATGDRSYTARWDANPLFGIGRPRRDGAEVFMLTGGLEYNLGNDWYVTVGGTAGRNTAYSNSSGSICTSCVDTAATTGVNLGGTVQWLDIWNTGAAQSTELRQYITDNNSQNITVQNLVDLSVKLDGTLMELPAGDLKVALGANSLAYSADYDVRRSVGGLPTSTQAGTQDILITREVGAVFGEALIPITDRASVSVALRTDEYSDFGSTTNPRIAAQYYLSEDIKVRASWAESFVAPALSSRGVAGTGLTTESGWGGGGFGNAVIDRNFSDAQTGAFLDWMGANYAGACTIVGGVTQSCVVGNNAGPTAIFITGGNDDLEAATGETWSIGIDVTNPEWLPGFRGSLTYYDALLDGMITAPRLNNIVEVSGLNDRIILLPTQAEVDDWTNGLPQTRDLPVHNNLPAGAAYGWMWSFQQINAFLIDSAGIDLELNYAWDTDLGTITVGYAGNKKTRFDQQGGAGGEWVDYLNTDANTTFSSLEYLASHSIGWSNENASAKLTWNHQNEYDGTNVTRTETIDAFNTFNLYGSYHFNMGDLLEDAQVFVQVDNLTDEEPPFQNVNGGYNDSDSSPLGRVTTIGFRTSF